MIQYRVSKKKQAGYMDMQVMPCMIGVVLLFVVIGQINSPEFNMHEDFLKLAGLMLFATCILLYGYAMHLYALGYPESPFNKHTPPAMMMILCSGSLGYCAYRFYTLNNMQGFLLYLFLSLVVIAISVGLAIYRQGSR